MTITTATEPWLFRQGSLHACGERPVWVVLDAQPGEELHISGSTQMRVMILLLSEKEMKSENDNNDDDNNNNSSSSIQIERELNIAEASREAAAQR